MVPLRPLAELASHEEKLLARGGALVREEEAQVGELSPIVSRHPGKERPLHVNDLVVRQREQEVLRVGVHRPEGQLRVVILAVDRVPLHVLQRVVHPAHVPLHVEAEPAHPRGPRDHRPGRGLLGDRQHVGMLLVDVVVQPAQQGDRVQVLGPTEDVGDPFPLLARVVPVKHRGDRVHAQPVGVILLDPELRAGQQEALHFVAPVIEDRALPVGVKPLAGIRVLVEVRPVEVAQAVLVGGEVGRHPVEQDADPLAVQIVHEILEVGRRAVPRRGSEVARDLISPGGVVGMLHDRQQLDVGEPHLARVVGKLRRDFPVGQETVPVGESPPPGAQVQLVDGDRR